MEVEPVEKEVKALAIIKSGLDRPSHEAKDDLNKAFYNAPQVPFRFSTEPYRRVHPSSWHVGLLLSNGSTCFI